MIEPSSVAGEPNQLPRISGTEIVTPDEWLKNPCVRATHEKATRPVRLNKLRSVVESLFDGADEAQQILRSLIERSFNVPQFGSEAFHHHEGLLMDTHVALILKRLEETNNGHFPEGLGRADQQLIGELIKKHYEALKMYAVIHDIAKADRLTIVTLITDPVTGKQKKVRKGISWEEWQQLVPADVITDPEQLLEWCQNEGISQFSYVNTDIEGESSKHGRAGVELIRSTGVSIPENILTAIDKHEVAYLMEQVNVKTFAEHFAPLDPETQELVLVANFLDQAGSLMNDGTTDMKATNHLIGAYCNFQLLMHIRTELESDQSLDQEKVKQALNSLMNKKDRIVESAEELSNRLRSECLPTKYNLELMREKLAGLITKDEIDQLISATDDPKALREAIGNLGRTYGKQMGIIKVALASAEIH